jgi:hypothetical protein
MKHGGYRIGNRMKQKLLDIDRAALMAHDTAVFSESLSETEKKDIKRNCTKIRRIVKEILGE